VHQDFSISDFKFIFFWEWAHRQWARIMGLVFLTGFVYFLARKKFNRSMVMPMAILFILGALQGAIGWIMVKSGLVPEKYFVGHVELTTHFIAALILLGYTLWFACSLLPSMQLKVISPRLKNMLSLLLFIFFFQLIYGGFMAGLRAAVTAPTWPDINGSMVPKGMQDLSPWISNLVNNNLAIHFIHRGLAYLLLVIVVIFYARSGNIPANQTFRRYRTALLLLILLQVMLGILTVLNATNNSSFIWLGVSHQFTAMLLVICMVCLWYLVRRKVAGAGH
jgi:cytochrome c oxidase assembly protein subunit 15